MFALEPQGLSEHEYRARKKELVAAVEAEMEGHWQGYYRAHDRSSREYDKWQVYCRQQREMLRELEDLKAGERQMYELDDGKDHVMTVLKLALANLAMWVRDKFFPLEYAHATWHRLAPFFRLMGKVTWGADTVSVEPRSFNDRGLNRDLEDLCAQVNESRSRLRDGGRLLFSEADPSQVAAPSGDRCVA